MAITFSSLHFAKSHYMLHLRNYNVKPSDIVENSYII